LNGEFLAQSKAQSPEEDAQPTTKDPEFLTRNPEKYKRRLYVSPSTQNMHTCTILIIFADHHVTFYISLAKVTLLGGITVAVPCYVSAYPKEQWAN